MQPAARFGGLQIEGTLATKFHEKPSGDGFWVSGGFFVCETEVLNRIEGDATVFEKEPLENLARDNELSVYKHHGFWAAMDTLRDRIYLEELWAEKKAPWKVWE